MPVKQQTANSKRLVGQVGKCNDAWNGMADAHGVRTLNINGQLLLSTCPLYKIRFKEYNFIRLMNTEQTDAH